MTQQNWPHQSCHDGPRKGYPVLWETFPRRRPELGKVRYATFTLAGAGTWVGKSAHPATDPFNHTGRPASDHPSHQ